MKTFPQSQVIGTWRTVRAEPPCETPPDMERFLHFAPDWRHYWEHPFAPEKWRFVPGFDYSMTERGVFIKPDRNEKGWELPLQVDGECLIVLQKDRRWWIRRISAAERPEFLTHFYEPPPPPQTSIIAH